jgi:predicted HicB family RNase H-like nuclease
MIEYKGYVGVFEFDPAIDAFHGEVANTVDTITFEGRSVDELREAFEISVNDYLDLCDQEGRRPDRPYSGTFTLRLEPRLHRATAVAAAGRGMSLNRFVTEVLRERLGHEKLALSPTAVLGQVRERGSPGTAGRADSP